MNSSFLKYFLLLPVLLLFETFYCQKQLSGTVMSENKMIINSVLIINISNNKKTYNDSDGKFTIEANLGDELRFVKLGYERNSYVLKDEETFIKIVLVRIPEEIEEVEIISITGNVEKDSK